MCTEIVVAFLMDFLAQTWVAAYLYTVTAKTIGLLIIAHII